jgi:hypothetical protein
MVLALFFNYFESSLLIFEVKIFCVVRNEDKALTSPHIQCQALQV